MMKSKRQHNGVPQIVEKILDRGVVVNARVRSYLFDFKLIELNTLITLSSFETAYRIGIDLPKDVDLQAKGWRELILKETCPQCGKKILREELFIGCPWCGYNIGG